MRHGATDGKWTEIGQWASSISVLPLIECALLLVLIFVRVLFVSVVAGCSLRSPRSRGHRRAGRTQVAGDLRGLDGCCGLRASCQQRGEVGVRLGLRLGIDLIGRGTRRNYCCTTVRSVCPTPTTCELVFRAVNGPSGRNSSAALRMVCFRRIHATRAEEQER